MKKSEITHKNFNKLLNWLDEDKEIAARKYQSIHYRLVQIFLARRIFPAEELADDAIDIAAQKIDYLIKEFKGEPIAYFYSIAQNIILEQSRKPKSEELSDKLFQEDPQSKDIENPHLNCLRDCLAKLAPEQRRLLIKYFKHSKQTKINCHKKMSEELGVSISNLRTKVYRVKRIVEKCVRNCIKKNNV